MPALIDPVNGTVRRVLDAIVTAEAYFVLVVGAHGATAFRADTQHEECQRFGAILQQTTGGRARQKLAGLEQGCAHR